MDQKEQLIAPTYSMARFLYDFRAKVYFSFFALLSPCIAIISIFTMFGITYSTFTLVMIGTMVGLLISFFAFVKVYEAVKIY